MSEPLPEPKLKSFCDNLVVMAAEGMEAAGAPIGMILDRLMTYTAAQMCSVDGSPATAKIFRDLAEQIDGGLFHRITGEGVNNSGARH